MWKNYSADYVKRNRALGISIMAASFIAALFLSFLCSMFYNMWKSDIAGIIAEEGGWHGRMAGEIRDSDLEFIRNFANVKEAVINSELSHGRQSVVDLSFYNIRTIYRDMTLLAERLGLEQEAVAYHYRLLSMYFVRIPGDESPRLLMPFFLAVVIIMCFSMILIIHHSFALSMNSRIRQFGIFSSIGATPGQIQSCLMQESAVLAFLPALAGIFTGIALSFGAVQGMNGIASDLPGGREAVFQYHPAILGITFAAAAVTILFSAWIPARKLKRLTPLEAIRGTGELQLKRKSHSRIAGLLFGIEGELAGNALKAQRRALRTTSLSLTFSFLGFMVMQCFFTLSGISTNYTYFERYQDAWDIMVTVKHTGIEKFEKINQEKRLPGVRNCTVYGKAEAAGVIPEEWQSKELLALGGLEQVTEGAASAEEDSFQVRVPLMILDDESFEEYCRQAGVRPGLEGGVLINRIWDSQNSNFRYPRYVPYVKEDRNSITLCNIQGSTAGMKPSVRKNNIQENIPILGYARECPVLREEYEEYALVQVIPLSLWRGIAEKFSDRPDNADDTYIRFLAGKGAGLEELDELEEKAVELLRGSYEAESENRIQEKLSNDEMITAYKFVSGAFCILLAIIGIANVFSNTLGFLHQRKREFARYLSLGLTPAGMWKILAVEALILVGRPILAAVILTAALTGWMISASYLDPAEFLAVIPMWQILLFVLIVLVSVILAYSLGGRKVIHSNLAEALRDDTMI